MKLLCSATATASLVVVVVATLALISIVVLSSSTSRRRWSSSLRSYHNEGEARDHRRQLASKALSQFADPKSVTLRSDATLNKAEIEIGQQAMSDGGELPPEQFPFINHDSRKNCQIIYITGVEGATHHGFVPIIETLARNQVDPATGIPYHVDASPTALKAGLFGWFSGITRKWGFNNPEIDDPAFVRRVIEESCPNDGKRHVLIEWASFPSGQSDDPRSYRVHRQKEWLSMTPEEIANDAEAMTHPLNMRAFYKAYSPFVEIKFVVLHRPFLETIASHSDWDGGPIIHSNVIRGFMLMIHNFLYSHKVDWVTGQSLWTIVCVDRLMTKNYGPGQDVRVARRNVVSGLAEFLDWPTGDCPHCFDEWYESTKDPIKVLGKKNVKILEEHMQLLEGVWPPRVEGGGTIEQQCLK